MKTKYLFGISALVGLLSVSALLGAAAHAEQEGIPFCAERHYASLGNPSVGFRCIGDRDGVFERVERDGFGWAWKDPSGVIWSAAIGVDTHYNAAKRCEALGAVLPGFEAFQEAMKDGIIDFLPDFYCEYANRMKGGDQYGNCRYWTDSWMAPTEEDTESELGRSSSVPPNRLAWVFHKGFNLRYRNDPSMFRCVELPAPPAPPVLGAIAKNADGAISQMTRDQAVSYCADRGGLPSIRQLVLSLNPTGDSDAPRKGFKKIKSIDQSTFYYNPDTYSVPSGDDRAETLWSSSVNFVTSSKSVSHAFIKPTGEIGEYVHSGLLAVRCVR